MIVKGKIVTLVVGSGAVENAWNPVIRAINKTFKIKTNVDGANFLLARNVYLLRFYSTMAQRGHYPEMLEIMKSNISVLKQNISSELKKAQNNGELKPRANFREVVNKFISSNIDKALLVTTNWDEVIDNSINKIYRSNNPTPNSDIECYHIHGNINSPSELYLPSEIIQENYRTIGQEMKLGKDHSSFMSALQRGNITVLYGISLDPLDDELNQTLSAGWSSPNLEEICIVNPSHEKVAERVKLLLNERYPAKIIAYNPNDLKNRIEYN